MVSGNNFSPNSGCEVSLVCSSGIGGGGVGPPLGPRNGLRHLVRDVTWRRIPLQESRSGRRATAKPEKERSPLTVRSEHCLLLWYAAVGVLPTVNIQWTKARLANVAAGTRATPLEPVWGTDRLQTSQQPPPPPSRSASFGKVENEVILVTAASNRNRVVVLEFFPLPSSESMDSPAIWLTPSARNVVFPVLFHFPGNCAPPLGECVRPSTHAGRHPRERVF